MTFKRIIFVRPGETEWNLIDRWQGWLDVPLNEHGELQARRLANFLRNIGVQSLYSSDLRRASQTADTIAAACGLTSKTDGRLRERNIGHWQGMTRDEAELWFPDQYLAYNTDRMGYRIPDGESLSDVKARMVEAFKTIEADSAETIVVVSHTVSIRALLMDIIDGYNPRENRLLNSSVTTIQREDDTWKIVAANDVLHLEGLYSRNVTEPEDAKR